MTRRELACRIAETQADDEELVVTVLTFADGVAALLRDREEIAFRVLGECQEEDDESAIGWSQNRAVWCVVGPSRPAITAVLCRLAEELHLYDGLDSPVAAGAGIRVVAHESTLEAFAADR